MGEAMAVASFVLMAASTAASAYSQHEQGKEQKRQAEFQADELKRQAKLDEERAGIAQIQGDQEAEKRMRVLSADIGSAYAGYAGSGLMVDGGKSGDTFGNILGSITKEGQADISTIQDNKRINVWNYQANAASERASAQNSILTGKAAKRGGNLSALGTSLEGSAKVSGGAYDYWGK